ncbi:MAG: hypothetical protein IKY92_01055 [Akkermansia sp.]|nr:hypothetical protein [Akkermansia sp.]
MPSILQQVECVLQARRQTLKPEYAAEETASLQQFRKALPAWAKLAAGMQKISGTLSGNVTLLVQENGEKPATLSVRAEGADAAALNEGTHLLLEAAQELELPSCVSARKPMQVQQLGNAVMLSTGAGQPLAAPQDGVQVPGGAVFSLNVPALARVLASAGAAEADAVAWLAVAVQKLEGCMNVRDNKLILQLRMQLSKE